MGICDLMRVTVSGRFVCLYLYCWLHHQEKWNWCCQTKWGNKWIRAGDQAKKRWHRVKALHCNRRSIVAMCVEQAGARSLWSGKKYFHRHRRRRKPCRQQFPRDYNADSSLETSHMCSRSKYSCENYDLVKCGPVQGTWRFSICSHFTPERSPAASSFACI